MEPAPVAPPAAPAYVPPTPPVSNWAVNTPPPAPSIPVSLPPPPPLSRPAAPVSYGAPGILDLGGSSPRVQPPVIQKPAPLSSAFGITNSTPMKPATLDLGTPATPTPPAPKPAVSAPAPLSTPTLKPAKLEL